MLRLQIRPALDTFGGMQVGPMPPPEEPTSEQMILCYRGRELVAIGCDRPSPTSCATAIPKTFFLHFPPTPVAPSPPRIWRRWRTSSCWPPRNRLPAPAVGLRLSPPNDPSARRFGRAAAPASPSSSGGAGRPPLFRRPPSQALWPSTCVVTERCDPCADGQGRGGARLRA